MNPLPLAGRKFAFAATLENWSVGMDYCAVPVPAAITDALGTKGPVLVQARVNDSTPFQVSLFPVGGGQHYIRIKSSVRKASAIKAGDRIEVRFTVLDRAATKIPDDLRNALRAADALAAFEALPPGKRSFLIRKIGTAVKSETIRKRIQEGVAAALERAER